jgi:hypothetical protein
MILKSPVHTLKGPVWKVAALVFFLAWGGFVLTSAVGGTKTGSDDLQNMEESVNRHSKEVVKRISMYPSADVDGDGDISFGERNAFLVAVFLSSPDANLRNFPYARSLRGQDLGLMDAYDVVRGLSYRSDAKADIKKEMTIAEKKEASDERFQELKMKAYRAELVAVQDVLHAQDALLDTVRSEPNAEKVAAIYKKLAIMQEKEKKMKLAEEVAYLKEAIAKMEQEAEYLMAEGKEQEAERMMEKAEKYRMKLEKVKQKEASIHKKVKIRKKK